jgi:hypothetical protein
MMAIDFFGAKPSALQISSHCLFLIWEIPPIELSSHILAVQFKSKKYVTNQLLALLHIT